MGVSFPNDPLCEAEEDDGGDDADDGGTGEEEKATVLRWPEEVVFGERVGEVATVDEERKGFTSILMRLLALGSALPVGGAGEPLSSGSSELNDAADPMRASLAALLSELPSALSPDECSLPQLGCDVFGLTTAPILFEERLGEGEDWAAKLVRSDVDIEMAPPPAMGAC